jgi:hypothetical protein
MVDRVTDICMDLCVVRMTLQPKMDETKEHHAREQMLRQRLEQQSRDQSARAAERQEREEPSANMQNDLRQAMADGRPVPRDPGEMRLDLLRRIHAREVQIIAELRDGSPN